MPQTTRAKFRCHQISLTQASRVKPGLTYHADERGYVDDAGNSVSTADAYETWDQPAVTLYAVTQTSGENAVFFAATPSAKVELTISNPDAAEAFQLGKEYYVDFTPAD